MAIFNSYVKLPEGTPNSWMVYNDKSIYKWMIWGGPPWLRKPPWLGKHAISTSKNIFQIFRPPILGVSYAVFFSWRDYWNHESILASHVKPVIAPLRLNVQRFYGASGAIRWWFRCPSVMDFHGFSTYPLDESCRLLLKTRGNVLKWMNLRS